MPPLYEDDEEIDYTLKEEDSASIILDELDLSNYDDIEKQLERPEMPKSQIKPFLKKKLEKAVYKRNQLKGYKTCFKRIQQR